MIAIVRWCQSWSLIAVFLETHKICGQSDRGRSVVFHHTHSFRLGSMLLMIVIVRWCRSWSLMVVFLWTNKICGQSEISCFPSHSLLSFWIHVVDDCHRSMMSIVVVDRRFFMNKQNMWTVGNQLFFITLTLVVLDPCCWWLSSFDDVDRGRWSSFFYEQTKYVDSRKSVVFHHTHSCRLGSMLLMIVIVRWCRSWSLMVVFRWTNKICGQSEISCFPLHSLFSIWIHVVDDCHRSMMSIVVVDRRFSMNKQNTWTVGNQLFFITLTLSFWIHVVDDCHRSMMSIVVVDRRFSMNEQNMWTVGNQLFFITLTLSFWIHVVDDCHRSMMSIVVVDRRFSMNKQNMWTVGNQLVSITLTLLDLDPCCWWLSSFDDVDRGRWSSFFYKRTKYVDSRKSVGFHYITIWTCCWWLSSFDHVNRRFPLNKQNTWTVGNQLSFHHTHSCRFGSMLLMIVIVRWCRSWSLIVVFLWTNKICGQSEISCFPSHSLLSFGIHVVDDCHRSMMSIVVVDRRFSMNKQNMWTVGNQLFSITLTLVDLDPCCWWLSSFDDVDRGRWSSFFYEQTKYVDSRKSVVFHHTHSFVLDPCCWWLSSFDDVDRGRWSSFFYERTKYVDSRKSVVFHHTHSCRFGSMLLMIVIVRWCRSWSLIVVFLWTNKICGQSETSWFPLHSLFSIWIHVVDDCHRSMMSIVVVDRRFSMNEQNTWTVGNQLFSITLTLVVWDPCCWWLSSFDDVNRGRWWSFFDERTKYVDSRKSVVFHHTHSFVLDPCCWWLSSFDDVDRGRWSSFFDERTKYVDSRKSVVFHHTHSFVLDPCCWWLSSFDDVDRGRWSSFFYERTKYVDSRKSVVFHHTHSFVLHPCCWWLSSFDDVDRGRWSSFFYERTKYVDSRKSVVFRWTLFSFEQNTWTVGQLSFITLTLFVLDPCCWWLSSFDDVDRGRWSSFFYKRTKYVDSRKSVVFHHTHSFRLGSMLLMIVIVRWCRSWSLIVVFLWTNKICGQSEISCFPSHSLFSIWIHVVDDCHRSMMSIVVVDRRFFMNKQNMWTVGNQLFFITLTLVVLDPCCWWLSSFDDVDRGRWSSFFLWTNKICGQSEISCFSLHSLFSIWIHVVDDCHRSMMSIVVVDRRFSMNEQNTWTVGNQLFSITLTLVVWDPCCWWLSSFDDVDRGRWSSFFYKRTKYVGSRKSVVFHHTHSCRLGSMLLMIVIVRWCRSWSLIVVFLWTNKICGQSEISCFPSHSLLSFGIHVVDDCHRSMMSIVVVDRRFFMNKQNMWTVGNQLFFITLTLFVWDPCCWWLSSFDDVDRGRWWSFFYEQTKYVDSRKPVGFHYTHSSRFGSMLLMIVIEKRRSMMSIVVVDRRFSMNEQNTWTVGNQLFSITLTLVVWDPCCWWLSSFDDVDRGRWWKTWSLIVVFYEQTKYVDSRKSVVFHHTHSCRLGSMLLMIVIVRWCRSWSLIVVFLWTNKICGQSSTTWKSVVFHHTHSCRFGSMLLMIVIVRWCRSWSLIVVFLWTNKICGQSEISCFSSRHTHSCRFGSMLLMIVIVRWCRSWSLIVVFLWTNKICGQSEISCFSSHSLLSFWIHVVDDCHRSMMSIVVVDRRFSMNKQNMWTVGNQLVSITLTLLDLDPCCWWLSSFDDVDRGRWSSFFDERTKYVDSRKSVVFHHTHSCRLGSMLLMIVIVRWCQSWSLMVVFRWTNKIRGQSEISCFPSHSLFRFGSMLLMIVIVRWCRSWSLIVVFRWTNKIRGQSEISCFSSHSLFRFGSMLLMIVIVRWCRSWSLIVVFRWTNKIRGQSEISCLSSHSLFRFASMLLMIVIVRWCRSWSLIVVFRWTNKIRGQSEISCFSSHSLFSFWIHVVDDCHRSMMSIVVVDRRFSMNEQNMWTVGNQLFLHSLLILLSSFHVNRRFPLNKQNTWTVGNRCLSSHSLFSFWIHVVGWLSSFDDVDRGRWSSFFYERTKYVDSRKSVVFHHTHSFRLGSMLLMIVIVRWCRWWSFFYRGRWSIWIHVVDDFRSMMSNRRFFMNEQNMWTVGNQLFFITLTLVVWDPCCWWLSSFDDVDRGRWSSFFLWTNKICGQSEISCFSSHSLLSFWIHVVDDCHRSMMSIVVVDRRFSMNKQNMWTVGNQLVSITLTLVVWIHVVDDCHRSMMSIVVVDRRFSMNEQNTWTVGNQLFSITLTLVVWDPCCWWLSSFDDVDRGRWSSFFLWTNKIRGQSEISCFPSHSLLSFWIHVVDDCHRSMMSIVVVDRSFFYERTKYVDSRKSVVFHHTHSCRLGSMLLMIVIVRWCRSWSLIVVFLWTNKICGQSEISWFPSHSLFSIWIHVVDDCHRSMMSIVVVDRRFSMNEQNTWTVGNQLSFHHTHSFRFGSMLLMIVIVRWCRSWSLIVVFLWTNKICGQSEISCFPSHSLFSFGIHVVDDCHRSMMSIVVVDRRFSMNKQNMWTVGNQLFFHHTHSCRFGSMLLMIVIVRWCRSWSLIVVFLWTNKIRGQSEISCFSSHSLLSFWIHVVDDCHRSMMSIVVVDRRFFMNKQNMWTVGNQLFFITLTLVVLDPCCWWLSSFDDVDRGRWSSFFYEQTKYVDSRKSVVFHHTHSCRFGSMLLMIVIVRWCRSWSLIVVFLWTNKICGQSEISCFSSHSLLSFWIHVVDDCHRSMMSIVVVDGRFSMNEQNTWTVGNQLFSITQNMWMMSIVVVDRRFSINEQNMWAVGNQLFSITLTLVVWDPCCWWLSSFDDVDRGRWSSFFYEQTKYDDQRPRSTSSNDDNHQQHGSKTTRVSVMKNNWFPTVHIFCLFIKKRRSTTTIDIIERWQSSTTWIPNDKSECDGKQLISDCPHILFVYRKTTINDHDRHHRTMTIINNMDPKRQEWVWWKTTGFRLPTYFVRL